MQIISPDLIAHIGKKITLIGMAAETVRTARASGTTPALRSARENLDASEADYDLALCDLDDVQLAWVETLFADALTLARAGHGGYTEAVYLAQVKWSDDQIRELEIITAELKDARTEWVQAAMSYEVSAYQIAKTCGRSPSTVQRWVK